MLLASANIGPHLLRCDVSFLDDAAAGLRTLRTLRRARVVLDCAFEEVALPPLKEDPEFDATAMDTSFLLALIRLSYGDMLESAARLQASQKCPQDRLPRSMKGYVKFSRLLIDSYLIACWTSAHAEWVSLRSEADKLARRVGANETSLQVPAASLTLVPYAITSLPDLGSLFERRVPCKVTPKSAAAMMALLTRCTNAGSRGWDSTLNDALADNDGCTKLMFNAMASAATGMHMMLHPCNRPSWEERMRIYRMFSTLDAKTLLTQSASASKETARMYTAVLLSNMPATREAMQAAGHPAGHLTVSPFELPPLALVAAMTQLLKACRRECAQTSTFPSTKEFARELLASLNDDQKKRKTSSKSSFFAPLAYTNSWLGRSQPLCVKGQRLVDAANVIFFQSFRYDFLPLWYYQNTNGHRVSRLDEAQHAALHGNNPAIVLCKTLCDADSLQVQRAALCDRRYGILTLNQAVEALGANVSAPAGKNGCEITDMDATDAARTLILARTSAAAAQLLTYNLGERTRRLQLNAVCRRLMQPRQEGETDIDVVARLPKTATHVMLCVECRRVANACQNGSDKKNCSFNELGVSSSMLRVDGKLEDGHMRCAKRSSAALRTALQLEEESRCASCANKRESTEIVPFDTNGMISRLRRDQKAVYDQVGAAVACGGQPLVVVPVVGRVINVFNQFYSMCSYCGCLCTVDQNNRYGDEICCMRCDFRMLYRNADTSEMATEPEPTIKCRYCGRVDPRTTNGNRFKIVAAPNDAIGHNECLPPPLRWVAFCTSHWRPWLESAMNVMSVKEVFAHISSRCRPIFAAAGGQKAIEYTTGTSKELVPAPTVAKPRNSRTVARMLRKGSSGRKSAIHKAGGRRGAG
jgi:hypothetical protein